MVVIYRSNEPDVEIPDVTVDRYVLARASGLGDKAALIDAVSGERLTYRELADGVAAASGALAALGVRPGQVVAVLSHNQPRYPLAVHAVLTAGATVTPMNPMQTADELAKQLTAAGAVAVITSEEAAPKATEAADAAGVGHRFVLGEADGFRPFGELTASGATRPDLDPASAIAALPFSSGTTGLAKGVRLTHRNLVANLAQTAAGWRVTEDDVVAGVLPFFHAYGFTIIMNSALLAGATLVTAPRYSLDGFLRMVQEHRVTRAFLAPPMVLGLSTSDECAGYDLSSLRLAICGAAPLDVEVTERAERRLGCLIRQGYGMTEASPGTHAVSDAEFASSPPGSIGRLLPSTEARLVDPATGEDAPAGELWIRGPQVMAGYLDNPAATADTLVEDGWLRTGDIVRRDESGVFWVVDRLKELIKYKGYQVAPAELESVLLTHPGVLDAAVVGMPHAEGGEAPKAFVVPAGPLSADEVMAWVAGRVAPYKKVRAVEFVAEIPRSAAGKILRRKLK
ncbi:AMP-binding protein [Amycolatopsis sp. NPDC057786]|uniref:AMP-binding protein n=1 Tax=Amycolatopsis sp. NPDC057786 TaxID=3346250 RepID=UPI00366E4922